jgi:hypothetical protein
VRAAEPRVAADRAAPGRLTRKRSTDMRLVLTLITMTVVALPAARANPGRDLRFEAFEVKEKAPATLAKVDLGSHPLARGNRKALQRAEAQGINFGGHMTAVRISCRIERARVRPGWSCTSLALLDRVTGRVYFPPELQALYWERGDEGSGFTFRPYSRLIHAVGEATVPPDRGDRAYFYEWKDGALHLVAEIVA